MEQTAGLLFGIAYGGATAGLCVCSEPVNSLRQEVLSEIEGRLDWLENDPTRTLVDGKIVSAEWGVVKHSGGRGEAWNAVLHSRAGCA